MCKIRGEQEGGTSKAAAQSAHEEEFIQAYLETLRLPTAQRLGSADEALREAYNRAHEIRQFEISLYWQRSNYFWTLQAAGLAGFALLISVYAGGQGVSGELYSIMFPKKAKEVDSLFLLILLTVWLFGVVSSAAWVLVTIGSKVWQDNWERHVDLLESRFSGDLYKTYPEGYKLPPYSVSKINEVTATAIFLLWTSAGAFIGAILGRPREIIGILVSVAVTLALLRVAGCLTMRLNEREISADAKRFGIKARAYPYLRQ